jgi:hypothetical protein
MASIIHSSSDGSGTIDFEEFYAWWSSPETHSARNPKLNAVKLAARTQVMKQKTAKLAENIKSAAASAAGIASFSLSFFLTEGD